MTTPQAVLPEHIRASTEKLLEELCAISSASGDATGIRRVAERYAPALERHGLNVQISTEAGSEGSGQPVLVARGPATSDGFLLLVGHLDTVLAAVSPQRVGNYLQATGALDMKGGLAALAGALDLLAERGRAFPTDLLLLAVPDEEVSGPVSERFMRRFGRGARAVLVLEPGEARGDGETLVAGRRGLVDWHLRLEGRASHSGLAFWEGRSALAAAAQWAFKAHGLSRAGSGPTVNVARMVAGAADFVGQLAARAELVGTHRQLNVVPDHAVVEGEVRFLNGDEGRAVVDELRVLAETVAAEAGVTAHFQPGTLVAPVDPRGPGRALVERVVALAASHGWRLDVEDDRGGISFPNFLPADVTVPVLDGLGPVGVGMHTREERLDLGSLARRTVLLADLLATL